MRTTLLLVVVCTAQLTGCITKSRYERETGVLKADVDMYRDREQNCQNSLKDVRHDRNTESNRLAEAQDRAGEFQRCFIFGQMPVYVMKSSSTLKHPLFEEPEDPQVNEAIYIAAYLADRKIAAYTINFVAPGSFPAANDGIFITLPPVREDADSLEEAVADCESECRDSKKKRCFVKCLSENTEYVEFEATFELKRRGQTVGEVTLERAWGESAHEFYTRAFRALTSTE